MLRSFSKRNRKASGGLSAVGTQAVRAASDRAVMDVLETRRLFTTYTVNTPQDFDTSPFSVTLRDAITASNANPSTAAHPNIIKFNVGGAFSLTKALPAITEPVDIEGTTAPSTVILSGSGLTGSPDGFDIVGGGSGTTIDSLDITNFKGNGVDINGSSNDSVTSDLIGTQDGTTKSANGVGVIIQGNGQNDLVEGDVISGNKTYGVEVTGKTAFTETISGNTIGLDESDNAVLPNGSDGVYITGGAGATVSDNTIAGNTGNGINISDASDTNPVTVTGNVVGEALGTALGNKKDGILLSGSTSTTIGGAFVITGNTVDANGSNGIELTSTTDSSVTGNLIGSNLAESTKLGNAGDGIILDTASTGNTIGGPGIGANVIVNNAGGGVYVDSTSLDNTVEHNTIGLTGLGNVGYGVELASGGTALTGAASGTLLGGTAGLGNTIEENLGDGIIIKGGDYNTVEGNSIEFNTGNGVSLTSGAKNNLIGSVPPTQAGNFIQSNGLYGVIVSGTSSTNDQILTNSIDLNTSGAISTANLVAPTITFVQVVDASHLSVTGTFNAPAAGTYTFQIFSSPDVTASGGGEGDTYLGSISTAFTAAGPGSFSGTIDPLATPAKFVSATATAPNKGTKLGDTSPFSNGVTTSTLPALSISNGAPTVDVSKGAGTEVFTVSLSQPNEGTTPITVDYTTANGTAHSGTDYDAAAGELTFPVGAESETISVTVNAATAATLPSATYTVNLFDPSANAVIATAQGTGTIIDSSTQPAGPLTITGPASPITPGSGAEAVFVVSRPSGAPADGTATVSYTTADGTAKAGTNYTAESGTLIFAANQTTEDIEVPISTPTVTTPSTVFYVNLSSPTGATLANSQASATIAAYTVTPPPPTSSIVFTNSAPSSPVNLTTLGTTDWAHWGNGQSFATTSAGAYGEVHDATGGSQISGLTELAGPSSDYGAFTEGSDAQAASMAWTNGSPVASSPGDLGYVYANNDIGAGYSFTAPESATSHTLYLYLGGYDAVGTLTATLPDGTTQTLTLQPGSAGTSGINGHFNTMVKIVYDSATSGTIKISYDKSANYAGNTAGSIDIASAALV